MTKEELEKYARENRKRLDAQDVKLGDVVKLLVGQFAGETGIIVGISACHNDYTDPYYEVDMNCEVPEKYKCRKTLITPNNVAGGLSVHEFEVIGNRASKQSSMEIKQGDKVRVSKDAPEMYIYPDSPGDRDCECIVKDTDGDNAYIEPKELGYFPFTSIIPTKYLVKVDVEAKEPKFKKGDKVRYIGDIQEHKGEMFVIDGDIFFNDYCKQWQVSSIKTTTKRVWGICDVPLSDLEPDTKPTEQTEAKETFEDQIRDVLNGVEHQDFGRPIQTAMINLYINDWDAYAADLAKEVALKVANKYTDPKEAAEYAVKVAKAVVEGLKRK